MSESVSPASSPSTKSQIPGDPKAFKRFIKELEARAAHLQESGSRVLAKHGDKLDGGVRHSLTQQLQALRSARKADHRAGWAEQLLTATEEFDASLETHLGQHRKSVFREYVEAIAWAVVLTLVIRAFVFEAFKIPTGSMIPSLQIQDHLFVNKFLYGLKIPFTRIKFLTLREPKPGEIVIFDYPYDDDADSAGKDLIKRVIGVAGDKVHVADNVIYRNGKPVPHKVISESADCGQEGQAGHRCVQWRECLGGITYVSQHHATSGDQPSFDNVADWPPVVFDALRMGPHATLYCPLENKNFPEFEVPSGSVLVMGDNRDNSKDGRFFGLVPLNTIKGKAGVLWYATDVSRIGSFVHQTLPEGTCDTF